MSVIWESPIVSLSVHLVTLLAVPEPSTAPAPIALSITFPDEYTDNLTFWLRGGDGFVYGVSESQEKDGVLLYDQSGVMNGESNVTGSFVGAPSFVLDAPS